MSAPGESVLLLRTARVAAEATVERLLDLGIEAEIGDVPNAIVRLTSGGGYRVGVFVPRDALERAQSELARWEGEAAPRVAVLAREVQRGLLLAGLWLLGLFAWLVWLAYRSPGSLAACAGALALLVGALGVWKALKGSPPGPLE